MSFPRAPWIRETYQHLHQCPAQRLQRTSHPQTSPRSQRVQGHGSDPAADSGWHLPVGHPHGMRGNALYPAWPSGQPTVFLLPHLVPRQALQQDLLWVSAPLQCNEVHTVQSQPFPGLPGQAPHTGFGGIPEPVPGSARVEAWPYRRRAEGVLWKLGDTDQEKCVTWKRAYRWVNSSAT